MLRKRKNAKSWPENCVWPEPLYEGEGFRGWDGVLAAGEDEYSDYLIEVKDYYDSLVEIGFLNGDYSLNVNYYSGDCGSADYTDVESESVDQVAALDAESFSPRIGSDFWYEDRFDVECWEDALDEHMNLIKIDDVNGEIEPIELIRTVADYRFVNENLARQAFTRRSFALEHGLTVNVRGENRIDGCSEELEFLGDSILNTIATREILQQISAVNYVNTASPFESQYNEGDLTKMRSKFVCKEHLAARCTELGLDRLILYGTGEVPTESSREDAIEALIGAVTMDCDWNWSIMEQVVDRLVDLHIDSPDAMLKKSYYDIFNTWHQKNIGRMPEYEVHEVHSGHNYNSYSCTLRFNVPENDKGVNMCQRIDIEDTTRSRAREKAAENAYYFVRNEDLWIDIRRSGITPELENSINQLQELKQKGYIGEAVYEFSERMDGSWNCLVVVEGIPGCGDGTSKTKAKKAAAYMALKRLMP